MDDVAEQQEIASEISDAISNPVGFNTDLDEVKKVVCTCDKVALQFSNHPVILPLEKLVKKA